jgi:hypothetical protein
VANRQRGQHVSPTLAQDVGRHARQLDIRILQHLLDPVGAPRVLAMQLRTMTR